jgi:hypothetical protein
MKKYQKNKMEKNEGTMHTNKLVHVQADQVLAGWLVLLGEHEYTLGCLVKS